MTSEGDVDRARSRLRVLVPWSPVLMNLVSFAVFFAMLLVGAVGLYVIIQVSGRGVRRVAAPGVSVGLAASAAWVILCCWVAPLMARLIIKRAQRGRWAERALDPASLVRVPDSGSSAGWLIVQGYPARLAVLPPSLAAGSVPLPGFDGSSREPLVVPTLVQSRRLAPAQAAATLAAVAFAVFIGLNYVTAFLCVTLCPLVFLISLPFFLVVAEDAIVAPGRLSVGSREIEAGKLTCVTATREGDVVTVAVGSQSQSRERLRLMSLAGSLYDDALVASIPVWAAPASSGEPSGPYREA